MFWNNGFFASSNDKLTMVQWNADLSVMKSFRIEKKYQILECFLPFVNPWTSFSIIFISCISTSTIARISSTLFPHLDIYYISTIARISSTLFPHLDIYYISTVARISSTLFPHLDIYFISTVAMISYTIFPHLDKVPMCLVYGD